MGEIEVIALFCLIGANFGNNRMQRGFYYGGQGKHILRARLYSRFAARCGQVKRSGFQTVGQKDHVEGKISQNLRRVRRQNRRAKGYCQSIRIRKGKIRRFFR